MRTSQNRWFGALALVFAASAFALDLKVHSLGDRRGKLAQLAPHDAAVPFGAEFPFAVVIFPGRLGRERKDGVAEVVPGVSNFGVSAEEANGSDAVLTHALFLHFCPVLLKMKGPAPKDEGRFSWGCREPGVRR